MLYCIKLPLSFSVALSLLFFSLYLPLSALCHNTILSPLLSSPPGSRIRLQYMSQPQGSECCRLMAKCSRS